MPSSNVLGVGLMRGHAVLGLSDELHLHLALGAFSCTGRMGWMAHRKWKEAKQLPGTAGPSNMPGCCLIYFHFLWAIHPIRPVLHEWNGLNKFGIDQHCCRLPALNGRVTDGRNKCIRFDKLLYLGLTREVISSLIRSLRRVS